MKHFVLELGSLEPRAKLVLGILIVLIVIGTGVRYLGATLLGQIYSVTAEEEPMKASSLKGFPKEADRATAAGKSRVAGTGDGSSEDGLQQSITGGAGEASKKPDADDLSRKTVLVVHVAGAVRQEGVYSLPEGARVVDAIKAAGGFQPDADQRWLNLAAPLSDGVKVYVPLKGEIKSSSQLPSAYSTGPTAPSFLDQGGNSSLPRPIDINTATAAELSQLPGVGPVLAQRIIDYRQARGRFSKVEDLMKVSGIGKAKFEQIKHLVTH